MNIRLKLAAAFFAIGVSGMAMANNYTLQDIGHGSSINEAINNAQSQIRARCTSMGGRIGRFSTGPTGMQGGRWYANMTGYCNGAN